MSAITITVCGEHRQTQAGTTLEQALKTFTPYGEEAVICKLNGTAVKSIDSGTKCILHEGDVLEIYPLIIGG